jgi:putative sigma-54 modulation protein
MDIIIQADGLTLTPTLEAAVEEKIGRLEHHEARIVRARVRVRKVSAHPSPGQYLVRVLVELPGKDLAAQQSGPEPMLALDILTDKITRQLEKRKTERLDRRKGGSARAKEKA